MNAVYIGTEYFETETWTGLSFTMLLVFWYSNTEYASVANCTSSFFIPVNNGTLCHSFSHLQSTTSTCQHLCMHNISNHAQDIKPQLLQHKTTPRARFSARHPSHCDLICHLLEIQPTLKPRAAHESHSNHNTPAATALQIIPPPGRPSSKRTT